MLTWWGDVGSNARTSDTSVVGDVVGFSINPGANKVYNCQDRRLGGADDGPNLAPNKAYIGWGVYVTSRVSRRREEAARPPGPPRPTSAARTSSLWTAAYPSGFQPYRNSHFNYDEWEAAGYDRAFIEDYLGVQRSTATTTRTRRSSPASPASSSTTRSPRTSW